MIGLANADQIGNCYLDQLVQIGFASDDKIGKHRLAIGERIGN